MPITASTIAKLRAEAVRCERLASGLSNPDLIASLSRWAAEYHADAVRLATGCPPTEPRPLTPR